MAGIDWALVIVLNGAIVLYGLWLSRGTRDSADWFLAAKSLPWWIVGLSMFATAVDSGDYVAVMGGAYKYGLSYLTTWWIGLPLGWFLVATVILIPLYRSGMFTNAEYLEHRFGPTARVLSAFVQIQYRTNVLGNIAYSLFLTFTVVAGWESGLSWGFVVGLALVAAVYTATGGLKSVAITDALQAVVMIAASMTLFLVLWNEVGGWHGLETRLAEAGPDLVDKLLHVGGETSEGVPAILMVFGWVVLLAAYAVVNQSQAMRMLAARSEWDLKWAVVVASAVLAVVMGFNVTLGVLGRALLPDLEQADRIFPLLVRDYLGVGLMGLVVAGIVAGGLSTYDSIGSALSAVFTRDLYARFIARDRDDRHYLTVARWVTPVMIFVSFAYIPFLKGGMLSFYLRLTSLAVMPLFAVYVMGTLTRVNRKSGAIGLVVGMGYGVVGFLSDYCEWALPVILVNKWWAYLWSLCVTSGAMVLTSVVLGWESRESLRGLVYTREPAGEAVVSKEGVTWLEKSRAKSSPQAAPSRVVAWYRSPVFWFIVFISIVAYVNLVVLW